MPHPDYFTLDVEPTRASIALAIDAYKGAWDELQAGISAKLRRESARAVLSYADGERYNNFGDRTADDVFTMSAAGAFVYALSDQQGNADVSCLVVPHWMELSLGLRFEKLKIRLRRHGHRLTAQRPDPAALARAATSAPFVTLRDRVCCLQPDPGQPQGWRLRSDMGGPQNADLTAREIKKLDAILAAGLCACDLCTKLRAP